MNATITPIRQTRYINVTDTAKLIRAALKAEFPSVKFSVKSSKYAGGASIDIRWQDGPTTKAVEKVGRKFSGASFDGMIDLKSYHDSELNGERVHFGADYVFCSRDMSRPVLEQVIAKAKQKYGINASISEYGGVKVESGDYSDERLVNELRETAYCDATGTVVAYVEVK